MGSATTDNAGFEAVLCVALADVLVELNTEPRLKVDDMKSSVPWAAASALVDVHTLPELVKIEWVSSGMRQAVDSLGVVGPDMRLDSRQKRSGIQTEAPSATGGSSVVARQH